jgi:transcriptional regulator with XRE-family HTH domain
METAFGRYLMTKRKAAGLSLRALADALDISHVYIGEVERGVRPPLKPDWWPKLAQFIPGVTEDELAGLAAKSRPVQLKLEDAPPVYRELGLALARRIENQDFSKDELRELIRMFGGKSKP